jgi:hypothetical protein
MRELNSLVGLKERSLKIEEIDMLKYCLLIVFMILGLQVMEAKADVCKYWQSQVDPEIDVDFEIDETDPKNIITGIDCLLRLEGKKKEGLFSGATKDNVSQIFPTASVEICALYYASYLFNQDWKHANAIALVGKDGSINSDESVKKAFESYKLWLKKLKKVGLQKAREMKLDPLENSGIRWY